MTVVVIVVNTPYIKISTTSDGRVTCEHAYLRNSNKILNLIYFIKIIKQNLSNNSSRVHTTWYWPFISMKKWLIKIISWTWINIYWKKAF